MQALRNASHLARLVLAWFALTLAVAIASPAMKPQAIELVCSGTGALKVLVRAEAGGSPVASHHTLDCPLCTCADAPVGAAPRAEPAPVSPAPVTPRVDQVGGAGLTAAPPPARGPPPPAQS